MPERIEDYKYKIIVENGKGLNTTQRKISRQIGLFLGMTNIVMKRSIDTLKTVKGKIQDTVLEYYEKGEKNFTSLGKGELADIVEISLRDMGKKDLRCSRARTPEEINSKNLIILLTDRNIQKRNNCYLNILETISGKIGV